MTVKDRKEREHEEMRELILTTAGEIFKTDGIEKLSIRKIAARIEYSPAIIYHYFSDKDDILNQLLGKGYQKIVQSLATVKFTSDQPEQKLRELMKSYINTALKMSDEYLAAQLSSSPTLLKYTSSLYQGASSKKPALQILCNCLKDIYKDRDIDERTIELTAQILTSSTFGLILKLAIEKNITDEEKAALIDHHIKCMVDGIILGKPLSN